MDWVMNLDVNWMMVLAVLIGIVILQLWFLHSTIIRMAYSCDKVADRIGLGMKFNDSIFQQIELQQKNTEHFQERLLRRVDGIHEQVVWMNRPSASK